MENVIFKDNLMLFDEIKKENYAFSKKLKILEIENENLKSMKSVCDVSCDTSDICQFNVDDAIKGSSGKE